MSRDNKIPEGSLRASCLAHKLQQDFGRAIKGVVWHPDKNGDGFEVTTLGKFPPFWFEDVSEIRGVKAAQSFNSVRETSRFKISAQSLPENMQRHMEFFEVAEQQSPEKISEAYYDDERSISYGGVDNAYVIVVPPISMPNGNGVISLEISREPFADWLGIEKDAIMRRPGNGMEIPGLYVADFMRNRSGGGPSI